MQQICHPPLVLGCPCVPSAANICTVSAWSCLCVQIVQNCAGPCSNCPHSPSDCSSGKPFEQKKILPSTVQTALSLHCISSLLRLSPSFTQTGSGIPEPSSSTLCGLASSSTWDTTAGGRRGLKAGSSEPEAGCNFICMVWKRKQKKLCLFHARKGL